MQRFACRLRGDMQAVRNAVAEPWSNGQTEGQINRLKTLKRAMYGRANAELLRARMMPLSAFAGARRVKTTQLATRYQIKRTGNLLRYMGADTGN